MDHLKLVNFKYFIFYLHTFTIFQYMFYLVGCLEGWIRNGNYCYILMDSSQSWMEAEKECNEFEANLVAITTPEEHQFVQRIISARSRSIYW